MSDLCNEPLDGYDDFPEEAMMIQEQAWQIMFKIPEDLGDLRKKMMFYMKLQDSLTERMLRDLKLDKNTELEDENKKLQEENAKLQEENEKLQKENNRLQKFRRKEAAEQKDLDYHRDRLGLSMDSTREQIVKANRIHHEQRLREIAECKERKKTAKNQWHAERAIATANGVEFETWKERASNLGIDKWLSKPVIRPDRCSDGNLMIYLMVKDLP
uniref:Uncharacterized protein n=1 Tax=viral metagenome TaxID=1070528 RepID=A0A6C0CXV1_9ZZZZ